MQRPILPLVLVYGAMTARRARNLNLTYSYYCSVGDGRPLLLLLLPLVGEASKEGLGSVW